ncbi:MAG: P-II family nitrogen regulator [Nitrospirae bacterium]|nr:P-II family nitrogen regulator [Candidatus Troglogloeales bacterium]MBI3598582.1 P-II family nitrogen regulator [Candidatus Troglogloeales bacterium]
MKLIRAIIRPEKEEAVMQNLEAAGLYAITKMPVLGRGKQRGIQVGAIKYDTLSKMMLVLFVDEGDYKKAIDAIEKGAYTGHPGDGRIFAQNVSKSYTIRTAQEDR